MASTGAADRDVAACAHIGPTNCWERRVGKWLPSARLPRARSLNLAQETQRPAARMCDTTWRPVEWLIGAGACDSLILEVSTTRR